MQAAKAIKAFQARLIRHYDDLHHQGLIDQSAHEIAVRSVKLLGDDERLRYEIPDDASPIARPLLEELQAP